MDGEGNGFSILWDELKRRFFAPVKQVTFWTHLSLGVVITGGLGIWLEAGLYYFSSDGHETASHVLTALVAFFPALTGPVLLQLIFEELGRNKRIVAFSIIVGFFVFLAAGILILGPAINERVAIPLSSIACIGSVLVWWIANGVNPAFQDEPDYEAPVGGSPSQPPSGNLSGFRT